MNERVVIRYEHGVIDRAIEGGPGLALLIISAFLLLVWGFSAVRHRRISPRLGGTALGLAVIGYLVYDWQHISLNCSMRDAQTVRDDCVRLLQLRKVTFKDQDNMELHLHGSEIPASFSRMGAKFVRVSPANVQISLIPEDGLTGSAWGFLYDPKREYLAGGLTHNIRATWYRDFYEFRVYGE
jgi:hypothetical protein